MFRGPRVSIRIGSRYKASGDRTAVYRFCDNGFTHVGFVPFRVRTAWLMSSSRLRSLHLGREGLTCIANEEAQESR
jgi:hypothetical protein